MVSMLDGPKNTMDFPVLIELYRSTFVGVIQDRFRYMLDDLNLATAVQNIESFDSTLQDHLADVWTTLHLDQEVVSESLSQELLGSFARFSDQQDAGKQNSSADAGDRAWQTGQIPGYRRTFAVDEHLARGVRDVELQHGQSIRRLDETYAEVVGRALDSLPATPWSPVAILDALSAVLDRIEVPIHQKVRLVLYEKFIKDVLRHLGEACLAFRHALNEHKSKSDARGTPARAKELKPPFADRIVPEEKAIWDAVGYGAGPISPSPKKRGETEYEEETATAPAECREGGSQKPWFRRYAHVLASLLLTILLATAAWQLGTRFAEHRHGRVAQDEARRQTESASLDEKALLRESTSTSIGEGITPPDGSSPELTKEESVQPPTGSDTRAKYEILRAIELTDFSWTLDPADKTMLFDFSIKNGSERRISGIEVVCLQYSKDLELLEPLKAVLSGTIEPNTTRTFLQIPAGLANDSVGRVSCVIPDVNLE